MDRVGIRGIVARGYLTTGDDVGLPKELVEPLDRALGDAGWVEPLIPMAPAAPVHPNERGQFGMAQAVLRSVGAAS